MEEVSIQIPKDRSAVPYIRDKYYVYALFKQNEENPFYIGKGKNNRVNQHFAPWSLKENSRKNKVIRKYGNTIKRDILCYFDSEQAAYDFEENLIKVYGLACEGGCLFNVAKSRSDIPDVRIIALQKLAQKGYRKYKEEEIVSVYREYFENRSSYLEASKGTSIPPRYAYHLLKGNKCKKLYEKYVLSGVIINNRPPEDAKVVKAIKPKTKRNYNKSIQEVNDQSLLEAFELVCNLKITLKDAASQLGVPRPWLGNVFSGKSCRHLKLDSSRFKSLPKGRGVKAMITYQKFLELYPKEQDKGLIAEILGVTKSCVFSYAKRYREELTNT